MTVNTTGLTTFAGAIGTVIPLPGLTVDAGGTTQLNGGTVATVGPQTFNNAVTLGSDTTLNSGGGNITFTGTIDGAHALTVNTTGLTTFAGAIGTVIPLPGLTVEAGGTTQLNGGTVATAGPQTYNNAVILGSDTTLNSGGGNIAFNSTLAGNAHNLTLDSGIGAGTTTFAGAISNIGSEYDPGLVVQDGVEGLVWCKSTLESNSSIDASDNSTPSNLRFDGNVTLGQGTTTPVLNGNVTMGPITFAGHGDMDFGDLHLESGVATITGSDVEQMITIRTATGPGG